MNTHMKDNIIFFLIGVLIGIIGTSVGGVFLYKLIKSTNFSVSAVASRSQQASQRPNRKVFRLDFQNKKDLQMFEPSDQAVMHIAENPGSGKKKSLKVLLPAHQPYPGITWEVFGRQVQNWSAAREFVLKVYNATKDNVRLEIKFKSGKNYPKQKFSYFAELDPLQINEVRIPIAEIQRGCVITQMSYVKIFTQMPQKSIELYFDYIGLEK